MWEDIAEGGLDEFFKKPLAAVPPKKRTRKPTILRLCYYHPSITLYRPTHTPSSAARRQETNDPTVSSGRPRRGGRAERTLACDRYYRHVIYPIPRLPIKTPPRDYLVKDYGNETSPLPLVSIRPLGYSSLKGHGRKSRKVLQSAQGVHTQTFPGVATK